MEVKKKSRASKNISAKADLVLKKHVGMIHCENKLSLLQRKICNIFLFNALDRIEKEEIHEISLRQMCSLIEYRSNDLDLIKKSIKTLISTVMEWNLLDDSKFLNEENYSKECLSWNASSLLAGATIEKGVVRYSYSPQIRSVLSSLDIYGRINLFVQAKFSSSYSLALYENCVRYLRVGRTSWLDLKLFRSLMGLVDGQYPLFKELKRNVVTVALNELNKKSDIYVEPDYKRVGRNIKAIRFYISENDGYKPKFRRTDTDFSTANSTNGNETSLSDKLMTRFGIKGNQVDELIKQYPENYISEKMNLVERKNAKNPAAYLVSALKNNYIDESKPIKSKTASSTAAGYLREPAELTEARSLKIKYVQYKYSCYTKFLSKKGLHDEIICSFFSYQKKKNKIMGEIYKKNGIKSTPAMIEFIEYVDMNHSDFQINCMNFDDFVVAEEEGEYA